MVYVAFICFLSVISNNNLHLTTFKPDDALRSRKGSANGGDSVGTVQREKMTLAMIGLCLIIGVMALLSTVYYTHANDVQNTANALQVQNANLQRQITQQSAQINALNTQLSSLSSQNQAFNTQVNTLNNEINSLTNQISQLQSKILATGGGGGGSRPLLN
jgi:chromosome segregation ATPase